MGPYYYVVLKIEGEYAYLAPEEGGEETPEEGGDAPVEE